MGENKLPRSEGMSLSATHGLSSKDDGRRFSSLIVGNSSIRS